jgi:hypothetical protein
MHLSEHRFCRSIQALAQSTKQQRALYPNFAVAGDELAMEFDEAWKEDAPGPGDDHGGS